MSKFVMVYLDAAVKVPLSDEDADLLDLDSTEDEDGKAEILREDIENEAFAVLARATIGKGRTLRDAMAQMASSDAEIGPVGEEE